MALLAPTLRRLRNLSARFVPPSVMIRHGDRSRRAVALTFDDGPDEMTEQYLELLERLDVPATFFVTGKHCVSHPDLVRAISEAGHELAGHGYTHKRFPSLSTRALIGELRSTEELLGQTRGRPFVRPPHGALSARALAVSAACGFTTAMWSHDSMDWRVRDPEELARLSAPSRLRAGDILLFHEGQPWTLEALPAIVESLRASGFELERLSDLVR